MQPSPNTYEAFLAAATIACIAAVAILATSIALVLSPAALAAVWVLKAIPVHPLDAGKPK